MNAVIYRESDGLIVRYCNISPEALATQSGDGECFYLNCPATATHIINNLPVTLAPDLKALHEQIRDKRNALLAACDWTQVADAPVDKEAWQRYRQQLRDFMVMCDPMNPVWPIAPTN